MHNSMAIRDESSGYVHVEFITSNTQARDTYSIGQPSQVDEE